MKAAFLKFFASIAATMSSPHPSRNTPRKPRGDVGIAAALPMAAGTIRSQRTSESDSGIVAAFTMAGLALLGPNVGWGAIGYFQFYRQSFNCNRYL
jgi:hypothetical protein